MNPDSVKREKMKAEIDLKKLYNYVTTQVIEEEMYLKDKFNLNWLATKLEIKAKHISVAISENNFENFSTYSNHFKIEKAKKLINNNYLKNYSVEALASASGFKAVNTFYRIFKNETGITPNTYAENEQGDD
jgi:YesN/AraC family two-component response regulator